MQGTGWNVKESGRECRAGAQAVYQSTRIAVWGGR
jgi:hypothetical protein